MSKINYTITDADKEIQMADKKNALAELAKRLDIIVFGLVTDGHSCDETIDIRKAQRIVEELARVRDTNWLVGHNYPEPNSSSVAVSNCRVIAEEGVKDGK